MQDVFFTATKKALNNITSTYDTVWPTAVGLWNLRCMVSLDTELLCTSNAEQELLARYKEKHTDQDGHFIMRTLKPDKEGASRQVKRYIQQCGFSLPQTVEDLTDFLLKNHLISR